MSVEAGTPKTQIHVIKGDFRSEQERSAAEKTLFSLLREKSLTEIMEFTHSFLGNPPLLVANSSLIYSPPGVEFANSTFLDMIRSTAAVSHEPLYLLTQEEFLEKLSVTEAPLLVDCSHLGIRLLSTKITHKGHNVAGLTLPESEREFGPCDAVYLQLIARFISGELDSGAEGGDFANMLFGQLLLKLLDSEYADEQSLDWLRLMLGTGEHLRVIIIRFSDPAAVDLARFNDELRKAFYFCNGTLFQGDLVYVCSPPNDDGLLRVREYLAAVAARYGAAVGMSADFSEYGRILSQYKQALRVLEAGLFLRGGGSCYDFDSFGVEAFLFDASHYIRIDGYVSPGMELLRLTEGKSGAKLSETLGAYLENGADHQKTCAALTLHRNTLAHRLERIEGILGVPLDADDNLFQLFLSSKICRISGALMEEESEWR